MRPLLLLGLCVVCAMHAEDFARRVASLGSFDYPAIAQTVRTQGRVDLLLDIDKNGTVVDARIATPAALSYSTKLPSKASLV